MRGFFLLVLCLAAPVYAQSGVQVPSFSEHQGLVEQLSDIQAQLESLKLRVTALEPSPPEPSNLLKVADLKLVGGFKMIEQFANGGLAIDFDKQRVYISGNATKKDIVEFTLPALGGPDPGANLINWPRATEVRRVPDFWKGQPWQGISLDPRGLDVKDDKLWVSARVFYDQGQGEQNYLHLIAEDGERIVVPSLRRAKFGGGFIKGHPEWVVGNGGYQSGQGSAAGPTAAKLDGTVLLDAANFNELDFWKRTPRPSGSWPITNKDEWYAFRPRDSVTREPLTKEQALAGEGIGCWNSDTITGGGVWTPRGLLYWVTMGFGVLDYALQNENFAKERRTYMYVYDPVTYTLSHYEEWPYGPVWGTEVGPDGKIYLQIRRAWKGGYYKEDPAIYVFEIE